MIGDKVRDEGILYTVSERYPSLHFKNGRAIYIATVDVEDFTKGWIPVYSDGTLVEDFSTNGPIRRGMSVTEFEETRARVRELIEDSINPIPEEDLAYPNNSIDDDSLRDIIVEYLGLED